MNNIIKITIVLFIAFFLGLFLTSCTDKPVENTENMENSKNSTNDTDEVITINEPAFSKITYEGDFSGSFPNPERGFYKRSEITERTDFTYLRDLNISIVHSYIPIYKYLGLDKDNPWSDDITENLPESLLENLQRGLDAIRDAGLKVILRPAYAWDWTPPVAQHWDIVKNHISQINEIISKNYDVVMALEAGILGPWGEWHSDGIYTDSNSKEGANFRYELYKHILDTIPDSIPVCLRYPYFIKEMQYIDSTLPLSQNFIAPQAGQSIAMGYRLNRIAYHDDSFMADINDWGSYNPRDIWWGKESGLSSNKATNDMLREWMQNIRISTGGNILMGGETEWDDKATLKHENSISPLRVLTEMADMHTTYMNTDYNPEHINLWKNTDAPVSDLGEPAESVYDRIERKLGYRLRLTEVEMTTATATGGDFKINILMYNDGFASIVKERPLYVVFDDGKNRYDYCIDYIETQLRLWLPGANSLETEFTLRADMPKGIYTVALWLPDNAENLRSRPEYSVRFANKNIWDNKNGYNKLGELIVY